MRAVVRDLLVGIYEGVRDIVRSRRAARVPTVAHSLEGMRRDQTAQQAELDRVLDRRDGPH